MDIQDAIAAFINSRSPGWSAADHGLDGFLALNGDPVATRRAFDAYLAATGFRFNPGWPAGIDCRAGR